MSESAEAKIGDFDSSTPLGDGSKLRILILNWRDLAHPKAGGAEVYTHHVAQEWVKMGHEVTQFCAAVKDAPIDEVIDGVRVVRRGSRHSVYRAAKRYYLREGRGKFDLVIDEVNTRPFFAHKWVKDAKVIALIYQVCRELWFYQTPLPVALVGRFWLEPKWLKSYRNVPTITISQSSKESLEEYGLQSVRVIPVGFETESNQVAVQREIRPTVIFVGRLEAHKRPNHVLQAFKMLQKQMPDAQLWIIGTGPMEEKLRRRNIPGVEVLGRVSNEERSSRLARAHVLVVTSVREGWGLVVTEAAAQGTLAVGYNVDGLRDSLNASNGICINPDVRSLEHGLFQFFQSKTSTSQQGIDVDGVLPWAEVSILILNFSLEFLPAPSS